MRKLLPVALLLVLVGCSKVTPTKNPEMIEVNGTATFKNQPLDGIVITLQPTGTGTQANITVTQGKFKASNITPGKYTWFVSENSRNTATMAKLPKAYLAGSMDRQIDISSSSSSLDFKIE